MLSSILQISITLLLLFVSVFSASQAPTWLGTNLIQAGVKSIVAAGVHQQGSNIYEYTYSPAYSQAPFTALGVIAMETTDLHAEVLKFRINIPNFTSSTSLQVQMVYPTDTQWQIFKVSYIAIDKQFDMLKVDYFFKDNPDNVGAGLGQRQYSGIFTLNIGAQDISHQISIIPLMVGLDCNSVNGQHSVFWSVGLRDANSINYDLTVKRTTRVFSITSYILVVDRTLAQFDMQIYLDQIYSTGTDNTPNLQSLVAYNITNIHAGINSFSFQLASAIFDKNTLGLTTNGYYNHLNVSVWSFRERSCSPSFPYYEEDTNLCYDICPDGYVGTAGTSKQYCKPCTNFIFACGLCADDGSTCSSCLGHYEVQTGNTSCTCPEGLFVSADYSDPQQKCRTCHAFCQTCNGPDESNCLTCQRYRTLSETTCVCDYGAKANGECYGPCNDIACDQCDADPAICQVCLNTFTLNNGRCVCLQRQYYDSTITQCAACHSDCLYCSGPQVNQCVYCDRDNDFRYFNDDAGTCDCISNYQDINGTCQVQTRTSCSQPGYTLDTNAQQCVQICGDGIRLFQQCDDKNTNNGDGCSNKCQIQTGYMCADNSLAPTSRSYCSFVGPIQFTLQWTQKDIYANKLNLTYSMKPALTHIFQVYSQLTSNVTYEPAQYKISTKSAYYDPNDQKLHVNIEYGEDIQQKNITLVFHPPNTAQTFAVSVSRSSDPVEPDNNLAALKHDDSVYGNVDAARIIGMIAFIISMILGVILMFFRKMMGLQLICMMQFIFFASMLADYSPPLMGPLQEWNFINGYNGLQLDLPRQLVDNTFKTLDYYDYFTINCNVMLIICMCIYGLALILYLLSMVSQRRTERKLQDANKFCLNEIAFAFMVFNLNNIVASIIMEVFSGYLGQFEYGINKFFMAVGVIIVFGQTGFFIYKCHDLQESQNYYHKSKNYTHYYPLIFIVKNLLIIIAIAIRPVLGNISSIGAMSVEVVYIIAVFGGRPFRRIIDYIRFIVVELTLLFYLILRFLQANFVSSQYNNQFHDMFLYSPYIVLTMMLLSIVITCVSFGYHLYRAKLKQGQVNPEAQENLVQNRQNSRSKKSKKKKNSLSDAQKSKELIIYDIEDQQQIEGQKGNSPQKTSNGFSNQSTIFDQGSRRKLKRNQQQLNFE